MVSALGIFVTTASLLLPGIAAQLGEADIKVPACPHKAMLMYSHNVPNNNDQDPFPRTRVDLCYDNSTIHLNFTALEEKYFHFNASHGFNDPLWQYSVMEAFIAAGDADPQTYLEYEVNPNNATFQAIIFNPSKVRAKDQPMDTAFMGIPFPTSTELDLTAGTWLSTTKIPLGLFNVEAENVKGSRWRMNFFRTITDPSTFPDQKLGAWRPPPEANFHMTPYFGRIELN